MLATQPPIIHARTEADLAAARDSASHSTAAALASRPGSRRVSASELAYLTGSPEGRRFLEMASPRALARGEPADQCPATAVAGGGSPAGSAPAAAVAALRSCLDQITALGDGQDCGCQVIALNDVLAVSRSDVAYATGISARLHSPSLGLDLLLVAEERDDGIELRDLHGPVAELEPDTATGEARLTFADGGGVFTGRAIPVGFRRGRVSSRYYLTDDSGNRMTLLVGFEPDELAAGAGAWLAWGG